MTVNYKGIDFARPGHTTVRIETDDGVIIYIDPWSEVLSSAPCDGDIVLVSHDDIDHYDPEGIKAVAKDTATVIANAAIDTDDLDFNTVHLTEGETVTATGIEVKGVPAYNRPDGSHVRSNGEPYHPKGTVIGFVLSIEGNTVYFPSDTDALEELSTIDSDVIIPPIGGTYTMNRHEAAELIEEINPDLVLPVHYNLELFEGLDTDVEEFKKAVEKGDVRVFLF